MQVKKSTPDNTLKVQALVVLNQMARCKILMMEKREGDWSHMRLWIECTAIQSIQTAIDNGLAKGYYEVPDSVSNDLYLMNFDSIKIDTNEAFEMLPSNGISYLLTFKFETGEVYTDNHVSFPVDVNERKPTGVIDFTITSLTNPVYGEDKLHPPLLHRICLRTSMLQVRQTIKYYLVSD